MVPAHLVDAFAGQEEGSGWIQEVNALCPPVVAFGLGIGQLACAGVDGH